MITKQDHLKLKRISKIIDQLMRLIEVNDNIAEDRVGWHAVARGLEIIGETTKGISSTARAAHTDFPWFTVEHLRDLLNHGHFKMEKGSKTRELKKKIISDISVLRRIINELLKDNDEIQEESQEKNKEKTDERNAHDKLLAEKDQELSGFREGGLYFDLSKENKQLTVGDLRVLKARMRRPTFDLMLIQTELQFILSCLQKRGSIPDDTLQLTIEHSIGIIGQSMKEIRYYHQSFFEVTNVKEDFARMIKARNIILHTLYDLDFKEVILPIADETRNILEKIDNVIKNIVGIMEQVYLLYGRIQPSARPLLNKDEGYQQGKLTLEHKTEEQEQNGDMLFGFDFSDDLFEDKKAKGQPHKWQYDYYSDDDEIAKDFFKSSEERYDETNAGIDEIEKIFEEGRERKRFIPILQQLTEEKKDVKDFEERTNLSSKSSGLKSKR